MHKLLAAFLALFLMQAVCPAKDPPQITDDTISDAVRVKLAGDQLVGPSRRPRTQRNRIGLTIVARRHSNRHRFTAFSNRFVPRAHGSSKAGQNRRLCKYGSYCFLMPSLGHGAVPTGPIGVLAAVPLGVCGDRFSRPEGGT